MNRGPVTGKRPDTTMTQKALAGWGEVPDWVDALATLADEEGLLGAEKRIGYSRSTLSTVIANKYRGDIARVEEMIRGALLSAVVECPVLGQIGRDRCLREQGEPFRATSAFRAQLYHACRNGCPNARRKGEQ